MGSQHDALIARMEAEMKEAEPIIDRLVAEGIHPITAHIMANDILSAKRVTEQVEAGKYTAEQASRFVGARSHGGTGS